MQEKRKQTRKSVGCTLQALDINRNSPIGCLVDLSVSGFMLLSDEPVNPGSVLQLRIDLAGAVDGRTHIDLGAESLWCSAANKADHYWIGFHIIDASPEAAAVLAIITDDSAVE